MELGEYRVMQWKSAVHGPWSAEAVRRFREQGFDGLALVPDPDWTPRDLAFLHELSGLRLFRFMGRLQNDVDAFRIETLEDLSLATGSRRRVPDVVQPRLRRLALTDRPGIEVGRRWPALQSFRVGTWRGSDLRILEGASDLSQVHIEGRRQRGELEGIQTCPSVEHLRTINYSVRDTEPLRPLHALTELELMAAKPTLAHGLIDLSDIRSRRLRTLWVSNASDIRGFEALASMPSLRNVRLIDCRLSDSDRQALASLPRSVDVELFDD